jgi:glycosyltransferase involved in cell wall biosynthesis
VLTSGLRAGRRAGRARLVGLVNRIDALLPASGRPSWLALRQLRQTLALADRLICHNRDDAKTLDQFGVLPVDRPVVIVPGAGVDLERFQVQPLPPLGRGFVVTMVARLDRRAGIREFAQAADTVRERSPNVRFRLVGLDGAGADVLTVEAVQRMSSEVEVLFRVPDVRPLLASTHLYVQSTWGEGMPRSLLEALAVGRPVIATDTPGCRDTIDERINGVLVPPRDAAALAAAIESVLRRPDLLPAMARASRQKAERRFDVTAVNAELMRTLGVLSESG